jgi:hypothetical protein
MASIMVFTFAACGSDPAGDFVKTIANGKFTFDIETVMEGEKITGYMAMDGDKMVVRMDSNDDSIRIIARDNNVYMIFDEMEAYLEMSADEMGMEDMFFGVDSGITPTKSGEGSENLNGKSTDYVEYDVEDGGYFRVFVEDGKVIAFTTHDMEGINMFVSNVKNTAVSSLFDLPSGYEAYTDMFEMMMDMYSF